MAYEYYCQRASSLFKCVNESFYAHLISALPEELGLLGTLSRALDSLSYPDVKVTKSALAQTTLRLGDVETRDEEALQIGVRVAKCTSLVRPGSWKRFFGSAIESGDEDEDAERKTAFKELKSRTEYVIDRSSEGEDEDKKVDVTDFEEDEVQDDDESQLETVDKENLIKGFKYGSTYVPCPDGKFPTLNTKMGIDICGFFPAKNVSTQSASNAVILT